MKLRFTTPVLAALALLWMAGIAFAQAPASNAPPNTVASTNLVRRLRPFVLKDLSGKEVKYFEAFKDKLVLLFFFTSWAQPCQDQVAVLVEAQKKHGGTAFSVVGISLDEQGGREARSFVRRNKVNFPVLFADMMIVEDVGGVSAVPTLCLMDQNRMVIMKESAVLSRETLEEVLKTVHQIQQ